MFSINLSMLYVETLCIYLQPLDAVEFIKKLFMFNALDIDTFEPKEKMVLVNLLNEEVTINGRREYIVNAIKIYTRSVFDALQDNDVSLIKFYEL